MKPDIINDNLICDITDSVEHISYAARSKARIVGENTLFVTCIGSIGKIGIAGKGEYSFNQQINAIVTNETVNAKYLAYALLHNRPQLTAVANAPVVPIINKSQFSDFEINIDSDLCKQVEVVTILDRVMSLINSRQEELIALDELIKARFIELFGDPAENPYCFPEVNISNVVDGKASNGYFAKRDEYVDDGNVSVLGVAYVVNRMYSQVTNLPRTNADEKSIQKYAVKYGDMLFCRSSLVAAGIGKASIVPEEVPENTLFECHVKDYHST